MFTKFKKLMALVLVLALIVPSLTFAETGKGLEAVSDNAKLQERAKEIIDFEPNTFTYPYGKFNENTDTVLRKLGFKATLSVTFGVNVITKDPDKLYDLKRICRSHNQSIEKMIKEGMETLKYIKE